MLTVAALRRALVDALWDVFVLLLTCVRAEASTAAATAVAVGVSGVASADACADR